MTKHNNQENQAEENKNLEIEETQKEQSLEPNYKEMFLRVNADLQNIKKRTAKERADWMHIAQADVLKEFFPLIDDLNRALDTSGKIITSDMKSWADGLELIKKNIEKKLKELDIEEIDTTGNFDPELHEALMQTDSADSQSGQIVQVLHKGYTFRGKVIIHAKVSVAK